MKQVTYYRALAIFFVVVGLMAMGQSAVAQESQLTIAPAFQEVVLAEGEAAAESSIELENTTDRSLRIRLSVLDFGQTDESGGVAFLGQQASDLEQRYALADWLILEKDILSLAPGESQTVKVTVTNRESLSPGGHYAAVISRIVPENEGGAPDPAVAVSPALSSLLFVTKKGGEMYDMAAVSWQQGGGWWAIPTKASVRLQNRGNTHVVPRGMVQVRDPRGRVVAEGLVNEGSTLLLPSSFRVFPIELAARGYAFLPGRYQVLWQLRHDHEAVFTNHEAAFWYVGFHGLAVLILGVTLTIWLLRRLRPH